jgi:hypothetical protein
MMRHPHSEEYSALSRRSKIEMTAFDDTSIDTTHDQIAELLSGASRRLRRGTMAQLTPLGLTFAQARVLRVVASSSARSVLVTLTTAGGHLLARLDEARRVTAEEVFAPLSPSECDDLRRLLGVLCARRGVA